MMSEAAREKLREMQTRIEHHAQSVTTRNDLTALRAYWNDIQEVLDSDTDNR